MGEKGSYKPATERLCYPDPGTLPQTTQKVAFGDARSMKEIGEGEVHLVITSPPYPMLQMWDELFERLGCRSYEAMHKMLEEVWAECYRVLCQGGIACINIGDALRNVNGQFKVFTNHLKVTESCERLGFATLPYVLWRKPINRPKYKGRGNFLGSGFLPPNAYITLDCEYILIFRKGKLRRFPPKDANRYNSRFSKEERDRWFTQVWDLLGAEQRLSEIERRAAVFPEVIPYRLIRMFSVIGDTVLDPFTGTGTTQSAAFKLGRNSIGYEIDATFEGAIREKVKDIQIIKRSDALRAKPLAFNLKLF
jgi:site-specific DNA-methyltransferase (cytosine-N4-specific)